MKFILILIIGCIIQLSLLAQTTAIPGYIISLNKDSLAGEILFSSEPELSTSVKFKKTGSSDFKEFGTSDLLGFGMEHTIYVRRTFINTAEDSIKITAFLKQLITGEYSLYTYKEPEHTYYLLQNNTTDYFLYDEKKKNENTGSVQPNYLNYLSFVTINCEQVHRRVESVGYNDQELADLILKLDNCLSQGGAKNYYHAPKTEVHPIIFAGALPSWGKDQQFTANFNLRLTLPRIDKHASLNIGLNYSYTYKLLAYNILAGIIRDVYTREYIYSIPVTFQYNFTTSRIQPYLYLGFSGAYQNTQPDSTLGYYSPKPQKGAGFSLIAGVGVEARLIYGLYLRADWRYEYILQLPVIGISYHF